MIGRQTEPDLDGHSIGQKRRLLKAFNSLLSIVYFPGCKFAIPVCFFVLCISCLLGVCDCYLGLGFGRLNSSLAAFRTTRRGQCCGTQVRVFQFDKLLLRELPRLYNHFKAKQLQLEVRRGEFGQPPQPAPLLFKDPEGSKLYNEHKFLRGGPMAMRPLSTTFSDWLRWRIVSDAIFV